MKLNLQTLVLEITRHCNMACKHCMRGDPEPRSFGCDLSEKLCEQLSHVDHLSLTGGEPSLAANEINNFLHYLKANQVTVGDFFVATNGFEYSSNFLDVLDRLYEYCLVPGSCALSISTDQFHSPISQETINKYKEKPYYNACNEKETLPPYSILDEGRAKENGIGRFTVPLAEYIYELDLDGRLHLTVGDNIYINALGDVLLDCDLSYAHQTELLLGNIMQDDLAHILMDVAFHYHFEKGYVYKLTIDSAGELVSPFYKERIFCTIQKAIAGFKNIRNNLICFKEQYTKRALPDDLLLEVKEMECPDPNFRMGSTITYLSESEGQLGDVTIILSQIKLADGEE